MQPSEIEEGTSEDINNLSPKDAARLFFMCFRFGQGHSELPINLYLFIRQARPEWRIPQSIQDDVKQRIIVSITRFMHKGRHVEVTPESIQEFCELYFEGFCAILNRSPERNTLLVEKMSETFVDLDHHYLCESETRPLRNVKSNAHPYNDTRYSFVCEHALKGVSTGIPVFDELFVQMRRSIDESLARDLDSDLSHKLYALIDSYNRFHARTIAEMGRSGSGAKILPFVQQLIQISEKQ